jgi:manganese transport protein
MTQYLDPPTNWSGIARHLGPGIIITASIVGSGELIVTPKLGSEAGFSLLWFIILGCIIKVFVQIELGRYAVAHGKTTIEAMDSMPGPRLVVSWLVWVWLFMFLSLPFQVAGMMSAIAGIVTLAGAPEQLEKLWIVAVAIITAGLLTSGRYRLVQNLSTAMVVIFTLFTALALLAVQRTEFHITSKQITDGLSFQMPSSFTTAFAAFGIIGVGASELIYYPYWCLEKGYARNVGTDDGSEAWLSRARGWVHVMSTDAWLSLIVYTSATVAFYLLGAAVLFGQGKEVSDENVIPLLSELYTKSFGSSGLAIFLMGGLCVLFSTVFAATASNSRLLVDGIGVFGIKTPQSEEKRARMIKLGCVFLAFVPMVISLSIGKVIFLVFIGALAQGLMLPFLAMAALYFRFRRNRRIAQQPERPWMFYLGAACLGFSALCMTAVGFYQVWVKLVPLLTYVF